MGAPLRAKRAKWPPATGLAINGPDQKLLLISQSPDRGQSGVGFRTGHGKIDVRRSGRGAACRKRSIKESSYSDVCVLYRSVKARLVGVVLIQLASLEMNIALVEGEEIAATHISQSAIATLVLVESCLLHQQSVEKGTESLHFVPTLRVSSGTPYVWATDG